MFKLSCWMALVILGMALDVPSLVAKLDNGEESTCMYPPCQDCQKGKQHGVEFVGGDMAAIDGIRMVLELDECCKYCLVWAESDPPLTWPVPDAFTYFDFKNGSGLCHCKVKAEILPYTRACDDCWSGDLHPKVANLNVTASNRLAMNVVPPPGTKFYSGGLSGEILGEGEELTKTHRSDEVDMKFYSLDWSGGGVFSQSLSDSNWDALGLAFDRIPEGVEAHFWFWLYNEDNEKEPTACVESTDYDDSWRFCLAVLPVPVWSLGFDVKKCSECPECSQNSLAGKWRVDAQRAGDGKLGFLQAFIDKDLLKNNLFSAGMCIRTGDLNKPMPQYPDFRFQMQGPIEDLELYLPKAENAAVMEAQTDCESGRAPHFETGSDWCGVHGFLPVELLNARLTWAETIVNASSAKAPRMMRHLEHIFPEPAKVVKELLASGVAPAIVRDTLINLFPVMDSGPEGALACVWCTFGVLLAAVAIAAIFLACAVAGLFAAFAGQTALAAFLAPAMSAAGGAAFVWNSLVAKFGTIVAGLTLTAVQGTVAIILCKPCRSYDVLLLPGSNVTNVTTVVF